MVNPFKDTNWNPDLAERRKFARSLAVGFPVIAGIFQLLQLFAGHGWKPGLGWLAVGGAGFGGALLLRPRIARPFYVAWYFLACCIGIVMTNLLLAAFFYLVITPTGLLMRALGRDPMRRRLDREATTYWNDTDKVTDPRRYYRQY